MDTPIPRKSRLNGADGTTLLSAIEKFMNTGKNDVVCDVCRSAIKFLKLSETAWEHYCECGKYKGTLRGL